MTRKAKPDPVTDGRSSDKCELWALSWNHPLMPVGRYIEAVDRGDIPAPEDMAVIADALRELFCHRDTDASMRAVAQKLGLKLKQGKRGQTAGEADRAFTAVANMVLRERDLVAAGMTAKQAHSEALHEVCESEGVALRTAQSWWTANRESAAALVANVIRARNKNTG